jgi:mono/diheme cytochrome c family protein
MTDGKLRARMWGLLISVPVLFLIAPGRDAAGAEGDEWVAPARAARKKNPVALDASSVATGKKLYLRECFSCHGATGKGDGTAAKDLQKSPGDLSSPKTQSQSDGALFWKITEGRNPMPACEKLLSEEERWHVVNYVRTLSSAIGDPSPGSPPLLVPDASREALSRIVSPYLNVHAALAKDDADLARTKAAELAKAASTLKEVDPKSKDVKVQAAWDGANQQIGSAAAALKEARDLAAQRKAFLDLSKALIDAVSTMGHAEEKPLRIYADPAAFDGSGASWLQRGSEPENPYLGAQGLRNGTLKALAAPK